MPPRPYFWRTRAFVLDCSTPLPRLRVLLQLILVRTRSSLAQRHTGCTNPLDPDGVLRHEFQGLGAKADSQSNPRESFPSRTRASYARSPDVLRRSSP